MGSERGYDEVHGSGGSPLLHELNARAFGDEFVPDIQAFGSCSRQTLDYATAPVARRSDGTAD